MDDEITEAAEWKFREGSHERHKGFHCTVVGGFRATPDFYEAG
jgi:hypothetical protein